MPPRRTLAAFLDQGDQRGGRDESGIINNEEVQKPLQSRTERNYSRAVALNDVCAVPSGSPMRGARRVRPEQLRNAEGLHGRGCSCDRRQMQRPQGMYNDRRSVLEEPHHGLAAGGTSDEKDKVVLSTSNGPLRNDTGLTRQKRVRRFGTILHFVYLGTQLWKHDWHRYPRPRDHLDLWDGIMLNVFISAQVGEYIDCS
ncbi:hypothetical protein IW261DRAFT_1555973 [Armillaria novae-zelandiae]|uniref:Uncharacterized protein n=1 Tax=Armillaria novae-zelandiae TaxID=153914 RepID=A0AA39PUI2_9AGAR|nr:hypothetical protein IW261DRAFT_1555973 [Armillaria novae-zelandiae]